MPACGDEVTRVLCFQTRIGSTTWKRPRRGTTPTPGPGAAREIRGAEQAAIVCVVLAPVTFGEVVRGRSSVPSCPSLCRANGRCEMPSISDEQDRKPYLLRHTSINFIACCWTRIKDTGGERTPQVEQARSSANTRLYQPTVQHHVLSRRHSYLRCSTPPCGRHPPRSSQHPCRVVVQHRCTPVLRVDYHGELRAVHYPETELCTDKFDR